VGESFSEIFLGNAAVPGMPCLSAEAAAVESLQTLIENAPETPIAVHVNTGLVMAGPLKIHGKLPAALRDAFLSGQWNPTKLLLDRFQDVRDVAARLPYISGF
jgi:3-isopropylmalate/(R)-2-methylmalate dehydratase small subunit